MANERKTEKLVRKRLERLGYDTDKSLIIEEQKSDNPRIAKLLKNASKKGDGAGYPEFIISSRKVSDFLIVIECKASPSKHASPRRDKYGECAVDGVLLYASFLSKEFDVLAVAVSGETESALRISHHLYLHGANSEVDVQDTDIRSFSDSLNMVFDSEAKFRQDYEVLLLYSRTLNEQLQAKKIKEDQRSMLICGILVALENRAFKAGYKSYDTAASLVDILVQTIINEFKSASLSAERVASLGTAFSFIRANATLIADKEFVIQLIDDIDKNVNTFVRTHKYYDAIGQFYVQFLRYANNDKGLGIVLTPPHIAELFAGLAEVNKDSVVFDNCCGTAGLLIAAMREMLKDAGSDSEAEKAIKKKQLIGIEFQDSIYALAVSNMVVHNDGKTNIVPGDCFALSQSIKEKWKPTVGVLNPPYKTKGSPTEELDFVLNNLDALQANGKCVAIVPVSCAIGDTSEIQDRKRRLLEQHTLEAVMSMPVDLFHDSKAGVATCVMVVTAHKPHRKGKKTWFGYWRDDGFVKVKNKGRIDHNNTWAVTKSNWLAAFRNRQVVSMGSLMQEVTANDEWCAEAYMETDYSKITREDFEQVVRNYGIFKLLAHDWGWPMKTLADLFDMRQGNSLELNQLTRSTPERGIAFVSRKMADNGIAAYVERIPDVAPNPGGELTCALSGNGVLTTCIQDRPYYTAFHVACLCPKVQMSTAQLLYYCACIESNRYKYSWGRMANRTLNSIRLPSLSEIPSWVNGIGTDPYVGKDAPCTNEPPPALNVSDWQPFRLSGLFNIKKGKRLTKANMKPGKTPFIGSIDKNNGVREWVGQEPNHEGNTITVNYNGSIAEAFYQPNGFWASDDVNVLYPRFKLTPATAMFLTTVIRQERYRFSWGRKWHLERMRASEIKLPVARDGKPDWDLMERYVNSLPFSSQL